MGISLRIADDRGKKGGKGKGKKSSNGNEFAEEEDRHHESSASSSSRGDQSVSQWLTETYGYTNDRHHANQGSNKILMSPEVNAETEKIDYDLICNLVDSIANSGNLEERKG